MRGPPVVSMQTAEHRSDDNWLAQVVIVNCQTVRDARDLPSRFGMAEFPVTDERANGLRA